MVSASRSRHTTVRSHLQALRRRRQLTAGIPWWFWEIHRHRTIWLRWRPSSVGSPSLRVGSLSLHENICRCIVDTTHKGRDGQGETRTPGVSLWGIYSALPSPLGIPTLTYPSQVKRPNSVSLACCHRATRTFGYSSLNCVNFCKLDSLKYPLTSIK